MCQVLREPVLFSAGDGKSSLGSTSGRSSNGAGSSSDDTIKNILEQARREMEAQQQALMEMEIGRAHV